MRGRRCSVYLLYGPPGTSGPVRDNVPPNTGRVISIPEATSYVCMSCLIAVALYRTPAAPLSKDPLQALGPSRPQTGCPPGKFRGEGTASDHGEVNGEPW